MTAQELIESRPIFDNWAFEASEMLRQQAEQIEALKADAERYKTLASWMINDEIELMIAFQTTTLEQLNALIDKMKGAI